VYKNHKFRTKSLIYFILHRTQYDGTMLNIPDVYFGCTEAESQLNQQLNDLGFS